MYIPITVRLIGYAAEEFICPFFLLKENIVKKPSAVFILEFIVSHIYSHSHIYIYIHIHSSSRAYGRVFVHELLTCKIFFAWRTSLPSCQALAFAKCFIFMFPLMEDCVFRTFFATFYVSFVL